MCFLSISGVMYHCNQPTTEPTSTTTAENPMPPTTKKLPPVTKNQPPKAEPIQSSMEIPVTRHVFSSPQRTIQTQFFSYPSQLAWSPNQQYIAMGDDFNTVRILDANNGQLKMTLTLPPLQEMISTAKGNYWSEVKWHTQSNKVMAKLERSLVAIWHLNGENHTMLNFSHGDVQLNFEMNQMLWIDDTGPNVDIAVAPINTSTSTFHRRIEGAQLIQWGWQPKPSNIVAFVTQKNKQDNAVLEIWDTKRSEKKLSLKRRKIKGFEWEEQGRCLLLLHDQGYSFINTKTYQVSTIPAPEAADRQKTAVSSIGLGKLSPDLKKVLYATSGEDELALLDISTGDVHKHKFEYYSDAIFNQDGTVVLVKTDNSWKPVHLWDTRTYKITPLTSKNQDSVIGYRFSDKGSNLRLLLSTDEGLLLDERDVHTGESVHRQLHPQKNKTDAYITRQTLSWSPDGKRYVAWNEWVAFDDHKDAIGSMEIRNSDTGRIIASLPQYTWVETRSLTFSSNNKWLVVSRMRPGNAPRGRVDIWGLDEQHRFRAINWKEHSVNTAAISHDNQKIAAGGGGTVRIFDIQSGKLLHTAHSHEPWVHKVEWSPHDKKIASIAACQEETLRLWDAKTGKHTHSIPGSAEEDTNIFSPNGRWMITDNNWRGSLGPFRIWNVNDGSLYQSINWDAELTMMRWSPNSKIVVLQSSNAVLAWNVKTQSALNAIKLPKDATDMVTTGWHRTNDEIVFVDENMRAYQWTLTEKSVTNLPLGKLNMKQYEWAQNTGSRVAIRPDGRFIAYSHGSRVTLANLKTNTRRVLTGIKLDGEDLSMVHDGAGTADAHLKMSKLYKIRDGRSINTPLGPLASSPK